MGFMSPRGTIAFYSWGEVDPKTFPCPGWIAVPNLVAPYQTI